jgi:hypothetical protein
MIRAVQQKGSAAVAAGGGCVMRMGEDSVEAVEPTEHGVEGSVDATIRSKQRGSTVVQAVQRPPPPPPHKIQQPH